MNKQIDTPTNTPTNTPTQNQFTNSELKQIEEMARDLCEHYGTSGCDTGNCECYRWCNIYSDCSVLHKKGYRRVSDVARGIDDIRRYIILNENIAKKCKEENGEQNEEYWKGKLAAFKQIRGYIDTELKKKYESEDADYERED